MYRINNLLKLDRKLYHTNDLALLWEIENRRTLHMTISRYLRRGILHPVYRGLYATIPVSELNPLQLGRAIIHRYTYLTTETVLSQTGAISQLVYEYTFAANLSRRVQVGDWSFRYRKLKDAFLYHPAGILSQDDILTANPARAAADLLYFNPRYHIDLPQVLEPEDLKSIQQEVGYPC